MMSVIPDLWLPAAIEFYRLWPVHSYGAS